MATNSRSNVTCARVARWVKGGNIATMRALSHSSFDALKQLDDMRLMLNEAWASGLTARCLFSVDSIEKNVKQFCGELLDRCTPNHWKTTMHEKHLCFRARACIASSLFSVRKLITSQKPSIRKYVAMMSTPQGPPDYEFMTFLNEELCRQIPYGWDRGYWDAVKNFTPPNKSNIEKQDHGTYRERAVDGEFSRESFLRWAGGTVTDPISDAVRATCVLTGGKWREITLFDPKAANLLPVHRALYGFLSKKDWLLRGEANAKCFGEFLKVEGEKIVSGDYEGATNHLNRFVTEACLRFCMSRATHIPTRVREEALGILRPRFVDKQGATLGRLSRGQLMGSPLSFPLLCLINYITFKYAVRREVPVKINGDDIVFRCRPDEIERWFSLVASSGLKVSAGKTLVYAHFFSLNSTYFRAAKNGVTSVPHFRASNIQRKCENMTALTGRVAQIKRDLPVGVLREIALTRLLRLNLVCIYSGQGSFSRRYLCSIPGCVLRRLKLVERESFYRSLPYEPEPLKPYVKCRQEVVPAEWKKESVLCTGREFVSDEEIRTTFVANAWTSELIEESQDEYWKRVRDGAMRYVPFQKKTFLLYRKFAGIPFVPSSYGAFHHSISRWTKERDEGPLGPVAFQHGGVEGV